MKQPKVHITDINGKDFGIKNVTELNWDNYGYLHSITVDFMGDGTDLMVMLDYKETEIYTNLHGNLKGELIYD